MSEHDERRGSSRNEWWFPVQLNVGGAMTEAVCRDISGGGMQLAVARPIETGTPVAVHFDAPGSSGPRTLPGKIVRCSANPSQSQIMWPNMIGVAFDEPDDELTRLSAPGE